MLHGRDWRDFVSADQERENSYALADHFYLSDAWDTLAETGRCTVHNLKRCTICLGEQNR
jgi:hypothetical protein